MSPVLCVIIIVAVVAGIVLLSLWMAPSQKEIREQIDADMRHWDRLKRERDQKEQIRLLTIAKLKRELEAK